MSVSALIERLLKPGGKSGWRAVDVAAEARYVARCDTATERRFVPYVRSSARCQ